MAPTPTLVMLDKERAIAYTQRALFRMGTLDRPFALGELTKKARSYSALVAWLWACLTPEHAIDFPSPEHLAEQVTNERIETLLRSLLAAIEAAFPTEKNGDGSTPGQAPSSSKSSSPRRTSSR